MARQICMDLYVKNLRLRYWNAGKSEKSLILDEFCSTSGYHRKHAIRILSRKQLTAPNTTKQKRGRKTIYDPKDLLQPLKDIWFATDQMCSDRLKAALPIWLPYYETAYGALEPGIKQQLLAMSDATIDQVLIVL